MRAVENRFAGRLIMCKQCRALEEPPPLDEMIADEHIVQMVSAYGVVDIMIHKQDCKITRL